jgi:hypothetical protein
MREWRYNFTLTSALDRGQLYSSASLRLVNDPPAPIGKKAGWALEQIWTLKRVVKVAVCSNSKPDPPARRYTD